MSRVRRPAVGPGRGHCLERRERRQGHPARRRARSRAGEGGDHRRRRRRRERRRDGLGHGRRRHRARHQRRRACANSTTCFGTGLTTVYSTAGGAGGVCARADLVIGAVLVAGAEAPKLVTASMLKRMKPGSVMVDVAIDQGGCFETSRADHPRRSDLRRRRRRALLRRQHAGGGAAHVDLCTE